MTKIRCRNNCWLRLTACLFALLAGLYSTLAVAQETTSENPTVLSDQALQATRLNEISALIDRKTVERRELQQQLQALGDEATDADRQALRVVNDDLSRITDTFEIIALGDIDVDLLDSDETQPTTWQEDLLDVLTPLLDSLRSITERPRQVADLRETIRTLIEKKRVADEALVAIEQLGDNTLNPTADERIVTLKASWADQQQQLAQELLVNNNQLERLTSEDVSVFSNLGKATQSFFLGRGLTLLIAVIAATIAWGLMRLLWWLYTHYFASKQARRKSLWFRLLSYSYYIVTLVVVIFVVLTVLYMREDLLLLALMFLLLLGAALSLRQFLPRYISEARILLNLGSVREGERVFYNGLPWLIENINLYSVLRNPALDGAIRLPLATLGELVSRPVKNRLWFPADIGDFIILPNDLLGQVKAQTPDLVEVNVRGGMSTTYKTADFYAINIINLSREDSFGVSTTFGLDYNLQSICLTEVPAALHQGISDALQRADFADDAIRLIVELSAANSSSLDYLVFLTISSKHAGSYYRLERLLVQTCVDVCNQKGWTIPFPQLTLHNS